MRHRPYLWSSDGDADAHVRDYEFIEAKRTAAALDAYRKHVEKEHKAAQYVAGMLGWGRGTRTITTL